MRVSASDLYSIWTPSECELRVWLRAHDITEAEPGPYDKVIRSLGERHEAMHLATFPAEDVIDISGFDWDDRPARTIEAMNDGVPVIYQPVFSQHRPLGGEPCEIVGVPDFLIRDGDGDGDGHVIRDCKLSRTVTEDEPRPIVLQIDLYGWLYEQSVGEPPVRLEVRHGKLDEPAVVLPYRNGRDALAALERIVELRRLVEEPYSPVGWTKCGDCAFRDHCWPRAEANQDVAIVPDLDQSLARTLRAANITTCAELCDAHTEASLSEVSRPWGPRQQRVGTKARAIMNNARSLRDNAEILHHPPALPASDHYVMFDLEGLPPQLDELDKIFLWGMKVRGTDGTDGTGGTSGTSGPFIAATAGFGEHGDREGWEEFLAKANEIFDQHGDIPFVHWHHYESTKIDQYIRRHSDPDGIAARVRRNLLDLLPITREAITLPVPSYSLKVIEKYVGYVRTLPEGRGDWAMAMYIEATETEDEAERAGLMSDICKYNEEDLDATWAVLRWLQSRS